MERAGQIRLHTVDGKQYGFRTPDLYDPARARRVLKRQGVRRPSTEEFRIAALAGIAAIAKSAGEEDEGARQAEMLERWYELLEPVTEDQIDEPDMMKRGEALLQQQTERQQEMLAIYADVKAAEATLERHWPPYGELVADREYWDDVSRIEIVRLLLQQVDGHVLERDGEDMLTPAAYQSLPRNAVMGLATYAFRLLTPDEAQRKN